MTPMLLDIGMGELLAIALVAAVLLGPEKVPPLAKKLGRIIRFLRGIANNATEQIKTELGSDFDDIAELDPRKIMGDVVPSVDPELLSLRDEMESMRTEVTKLRLQSGKPLIPPKPAQSVPQALPPT